MLASDDAGGWLLLCVMFVLEICLVERVFYFSVRGGGEVWREREVVGFVGCLDRRLGYVCFDDGFVSGLENFRRRYAACLWL